MIARDAARLAYGAQDWEAGMMRKYFVLPAVVKDDRGAAAVEFALVAPVFFLVLGAVVETGLMLFTEYVLQSSVQEAARMVRTGQAQNATMGAAAFKDEICGMAGIVLDCDADVTVYVRAETNFTTLKDLVPSYLSVGSSYDATPEETSYDCGAPSEAVAIIATFDWDFVMPGMTAYGNIDGDSKRRLAGFAMFQNEPFPAGTACGA
jgi:Flp pilus assembly pilin Flp